MLSFTHHINSYGTCTVCQGLGNELNKHNSDEIQIKLVCVWYSKVKRSLVIQTNQSISFQSQKENYHCINPNN